jgi:hypothetical protein
MSELTREQHLLNTLMHDISLTEIQYEEIRLHFIDKIFSYKDSSVFDFLVEWNINYKKFVELKMDLMSIPSTTKILVGISDLIDELDYKHKS